MTVAPMTTSWASVPVLLFTAFLWTFKAISVTFITWRVNWATRSDRGWLAGDPGRVLFFRRGNLSIPADGIMWGSHWTRGWWWRNGFIRLTDNDIPPCSSFIWFFLLLALRWRLLWPQMGWWSWHGWKTIGLIEGFIVLKVVNGIEGRSDWWKSGQQLCWGKLATDSNWSKRAEMKVGSWSNNLWCSLLVLYQRTEAFVER